MNKIVKLLSKRTVYPLVKKYLSSTRIYNYKGLKLTIPPQVFHPGFFFSSKLMLQYVLTLKLQGKNLLELGAGSGLTSFMAAKKGAVVTATDINKIAIQQLQANQQANNIFFTTIMSDLFDSIRAQQFDVIAINPPYYKKDPTSEADFAWYCGENGQYFSKLFANLKRYLHAGSEVIMILCDECDMAMIEKIAGQDKFKLHLVKKYIKFSEVNYIFKIEYAGALNN